MWQFFDRSYHYMISYLCSSSKMLGFVGWFQFRLEVSDVAAVASPWNRNSQSWVTISYDYDATQASTWRQLHSGLHIQTRTHAL